MYSYISIIVNKVEDYNTLLYRMAYRQHFCYKDRTRIQTTYRHTNTTSWECYYQETISIHLLSSIVIK